MADTHPRPKSTASRRTRGRRARGDVRAQVLKAATRLFAAHGFDGTSIQAVADEVGVSKPSVLHHFPSKEALHASVIEEILGHWKETIPEILLHAAGREDRFDHLTGALVRFFADDPDRARLLMREAMDHPEESRTWYAEHVQPWLALFAHGIREGQAAGLYRGDVDAEEYLPRILQLIVSAVGAGNVLEGASKGTPRERSERRTREVIRIIRTSLFKDGAVALAPKART